MSMRRMTALQAGLLLVAMFANAASRNSAIRIQVLDSETRSVSFDNNGVPLNCDQLTFDAYCRSSRTPQMISILLVQEGDGPPFRISCTIESRFSRCTPLPKGATFDARREKKGITLYYLDDKGKPRKQLYAFVDPGRKGDPPEARRTVATELAPATAEKAVPPPIAAPKATIVELSQTPVPPTHSSLDVAPASARVANPEKVKCKFSSTPAGAEITLDGKYVGNTPSELSLSTGAHTVVFSMPGFAQWQRELTVLPASELNVSMVLQKQ
jgi:hypothetical protein